jgi:hypothetical protein
MNRLWQGSLAVLMAFCQNLTKREPDVSHKIQSGAGLDKFAASLLRNQSAYPPTLRLRLVGVAKGIHDTVCLVASLALVRDVRLFVENKEKIHEITTNSTSL